MPRKLSIDIETYSSYDLSEVGVYKYTESPDFAILLFAFAFDNEPVQVVDLASGEKLPDDVADALSGYDDVELCAHNAAFERVCIDKYFGHKTDIAQWHCTMVHASMLGLPLALGQVAKVLKLADQKDARGKLLIRTFCGPRKPTKSNSSLRNLPTDEPEKWAEFIEYCRQDVVVERNIRNKIAWYEIPQTERELYCLDQKINDTGVLLDIPFIENAIRIDADYRARLEKEAVELTGLDNPNSVAQLKKWLEQETGGAIEKLTKDTVTQLLGNDNSERVDRLLTIRQEMSKTSNKKYHAMLAGVCADGRFRGLFQFYGANRTGRWAGRLVQVQNLPKNKIEGDDLDFARRLVAEGDAEGLEFFYGNVPDTLSQLIRTAFIAPTGNKLRVCDFSAGEARVIAWLAKEKWRMDVFATHGKIYEASASQMFKVPIDSIVKGGANYELRSKGKIAELACGFGGGVGALEKMGALKMGLRQDELQPLITAWRVANLRIVLFWKAMETAAITAVETGEKQTLQFGISFHVRNSVLFMTLPSGRQLGYMRPKLSPGKYGASLSYEGMNQTTKQWQREDTYGGKLVENCVQATQRDWLAFALLSVDKAGYPIALHVHDEVVTDVPETFGSVADLEHVMTEPIPWAAGLPLKAEGFESNYYKK
jgi:DNA polymerase